MNGYGWGGIWTTQNQRPNPVIPPATVTDANNGTSLNGTTVVLGNDVGGILATLLSDREIPMDSFFIRLLSSTQQNGNLILSAGNIAAGNFGNSKLMNEGSTITKRNTINSETDIVIDPNNDCFGIFVFSVPQP